MIFEKKLNASGKKHLEAFSLLKRGCEVRETLLSPFLHSLGFV